MRTGAEDSADLFAPPVSGASRRLRALAALSGSLTDALGPDEAAGLVEQQALTALGATSAVVVTLGPFPPVPTQASPAGPNGTAMAVVPLTPSPTAKLHVVHTIGLPAEIRAALDELPLDAPVPLAEVARSGEPLFLATESELSRYPDWGAAMQHAGARAAAVVPVWANGELRGVLGLAWGEPRIFDEDERAFVLTLGVMCAQAIMRAHLKAAESAARVAAEEANNSKAHFLATISHELRTPVNAVLGYTQLLSDEIDGPVSARQREHLGRMQASGKHLFELIEDLLGYARIEAGEEVVRPTPVQLAEVVEQSLLLVRPLAMQRGLHIRIAEPVPAIQLLTDSRKLRQVLVNVLANAVKFTTAGDVVLVLRAEGEDDDMQVFFEISDRGLGIAAEHQERVFDAFWQVDPEALHDAGSSGLGLFVARRIIRMLGGDVRVSRSSPGDGSTFVVWLPARYHEAALVTPSGD